MTESAPDWYHAGMNRAGTIFFCALLGFATLLCRRVFASPADLAEDLAALVAEGRGVLMPSLDEPHIEYRGVQTLSGDFPTDFQRGLSPVIEHGITVYPIAIRIDGDTGDAVFYNANETSFYTVPRIAPANWLTLLHPLFPSNPWFAESRVIAQWTLVPEESLDGYLAASAPPPAPQLRSTPSPSGTLEVTNLMFTAISASDSNVVLDVAWPTNDIPPDGILDLYFKPDLATNVWTFLDSATPTGPTNATFTVDGADLPGFIHDEPPHVHDATCVPITNIIQSVFLSDTDGLSVAMASDRIITSVYETELLEIALDTAHTSGEMVFRIEPEVEGGARLHLTMIDPVPLCQAGPANSVWVLP